MLEKFLNFILRGLMGLCTIFMVNHFVITDFPLCDVGMNLFTFLTSGLLGIPGVCALYAINFYVLLYPLYKFVIFHKKSIYNNKIFVYNPYYKNKVVIRLRS